MKIEVYFKRRKALDYLEARGIAVTPFSNASLERFSLAGGFEFNGRSGVVLSPKEDGGLCDADLSLFASEGLSFVIEEIGAELLFYGRSDQGEKFVLQRALGPRALKLFPTEAMFKYLFYLLHYNTDTQQLSASGLANILIARLSDEKAGTQDDWGCFVAASEEKCQSFLQRVVGELEILEIDKDAVLRFCAILSGFRLTPTTTEETDILVDFFARVRVSNAPLLHKILPLGMAPVFRAIGENLDGVTLETDVLGSHLSVLSGGKSNALLLCLQVWAFLPLLQALFPDVHVVNSHCDEPSTERQTDIMIVTSTYYHTEWLEKKIAQCRVNGILIVVSFGHVDTNNNEACGNELLKRVQILGCIHLPLAFGGRRTKSQWSMLLMKKTEHLPSDYDFSILEFESKDFHGDALATTVELVKNIVQGKTKHATHRCLSGKILKKSLEA